MIARGWSHDLASPFEAMVYTTVQEMATRAFYIHAAHACEPQDPALARALRRIASDEIRHYAFYRDVVKAHLEADPDYAVAVADVMVRFQMPGYVLPDFQERSSLLASEGVFGPEQYYRDVVEVVCSFWEIDTLKPSLPAARRALARLRVYRAALRRLAGRTSALQPSMSRAG